MYYICFFIIPIVIFDVEYSYICYIIIFDFLIDLNIILFILLLYVTLQNI